MKNFIKSLLFIIIFVFLFSIIYKTLWLPKNSTSYFFDEPNNSMDVVYIGASNAYIHFNTTLAYKEYGFTTGMLSTGNQPVVLTKYLIKEAQKYQKPSLYIIDLTQFGLDLDNYNEGDIRNSIDSIPFSKNRLEAIDAVFKYIDVTKNNTESPSGNNKINYYFSFLKYHNSWKSLIDQNFIGNKNYYKSFYAENTTFLKTPFDTYIWSKEKVDISIEMQEILLDLLNYIKDNKLDVLFVIPVRAYQLLEKNLPEKLNTVTEIIENNDFKVINFNTLDDFKIDFSYQLHNGGHINIYGATKYTLYLGTYLKENYDLQDRRNNNFYVSWDKEYNRLKDFYYFKTNQNYDDLVTQYRNELFNNKT